jgi:hypothetical protein
MKSSNILYSTVDIWKETKSTVYLVLSQYEAVVLPALHVLGHPDQLQDALSTYYLVFSEKK